MADQDANNDITSSQPVYHTGISSTLATSSSLSSQQAESTSACLNNSIIDIYLTKIDKMTAVIDNCADIVREESSNVVSTSQPQKNEETYENSPQSSDINGVKDISETDSPSNLETQTNQETVGELLTRTEDIQENSVDTRNEGAVFKITDNQKIEGDCMIRKRTREDNTCKKEVKLRKLPKKEMKGCKLLAATFGTGEDNYRLRFHKIDLEKPNWTKSSKIPYCYDPRKIKQLMRECLDEMLEKFASMSPVNWETESLGEQMSGRELEKCENKIDENFNSVHEVLSILQEENVVSSSDSSDGSDENWERCTPETHYADEGIASGSSTPLASPTYSVEPVISAQRHKSPPLVPELLAEYTGGHISNSSGKIIKISTLKKNRKTERKTIESDHKDNNCVDPLGDQTMSEVPRKEEKTSSHSKVSKHKKRERSSEPPKKKSRSSEESGKKSSRDKDSKSSRKRERSSEKRRKSKSHHDYERSRKSSTSFSKSNGTNKDIAHSENSNAITSSHGSSPTSSEKKITKVGCQKGRRISRLNSTELKLNNLFGPHDEEEAVSNNEKAMDTSSDKINGDEGLDPFTELARIHREALEAAPKKPCTSTTEAKDYLGRMRLKLEKEREEIEKRVLCETTTSPPANRAKKPKSSPETKVNEDASPTKVARIIAEVPLPAEVVKGVEELQTEPVELPQISEPPVCRVAPTTSNSQAACNIPFIGENSTDKGGYEPMDFSDDSNETLLLSSPKNPAEVSCPPEIFSDRNVRPTTDMADIEGLLESMESSTTINGEKPVADKNVVQEKVREKSIFHIKPTEKIPDQVPGNVNECSSLCGKVIRLINTLKNQIGNRHCEREPSFKIQVGHFTNNFNKLRALTKVRSSDEVIDYICKYSTKFGLAVKVDDARKVLKYSRPRPPHSMVKNELFNGYSIENKKKYDQSRPTSSPFSIEAFQYNSFLPPQHLPNGLNPNYQKPSFPMPNHQHQETSPPIYNNQRLPNPMPTMEKQYPQQHQGFPNQQNPIQNLSCGMSAMNHQLPTQHSQSSIPSLMQMNLSLPGSPYQPTFVASNSQSTSTPQPVPSPTYQPVPPPNHYPTPSPNYQPGHPSNHQLPSSFFSPPQAQQYTPPSGAPYSSQTCTQTQNQNPFSQFQPPISQSSNFPQQQPTPQSAAPLPNYPDVNGAMNVRDPRVRANPPTPPGLAPPPPPPPPPPGQPAVGNQPPLPGTPRLVSQHVITTTQKINPGEPFPSPAAQAHSQEKVLTLLTLKEQESAFSELHARIAAIRGMKPRTKEEYEMLKREIANLRRMRDSLYRAKETSWNLALQTLTIPEAPPMSIEPAQVQQQLMPVMGRDSQESPGVSYPQILNSQQDQVNQESVPAGEFVTAPITEPPATQNHPQSGPSACEPTKLAEPPVTTTTAPVLPSDLPDKDSFIKEVREVKSMIARLFPNNPISNANPSETALPQLVLPITVPTRPNEDTSPEQPTSEVPESTSENNYCPLDSSAGPPRRIGNNTRRRVLRTLVKQENIEVIDLSSDDEDVKPTPSIIEQSLHMDDEISYIGIAQEMGIDLTTNCVENSGEPAVVENNISEPIPTAKQPENHVPTSELDENQNENSIPFPTIENVGTINMNEFEGEGTSDENIVIKQEIDSNQNVKKNSMCINCCQQLANYACSFCRRVLFCSTLCADTSDHFRLDTCIFVESIPVVDLADSGDES